MSLCQLRLRWINGINSYCLEGTLMKMLSDFVLKLLTRSPMARWSPIPVRLIVGYGFMQHGYAKLSRGPGMFAAILQGMGVPAPHFLAWLTVLTELLGGLAVLLGAFVTIASVPMTAVLLVAMFKVHLPYGFSSIKLLAVAATGAKFGPVGYETRCSCRLVSHNCVGPHFCRCRPRPTRIATREGGVVANWARQQRHDRFTARTGRSESRNGESVG